MMRKIAIAILVVYAGIVVYANMRFRNPSMDLQPIQVQAFQLSGLDSTEVKSYCEQIKKDEHITALSYDKDSQLLSVSYHYQEVPSEKLMLLLGDNGAVKVTPKTFAQKPTCPVHGYLAVWHKFLEFHTF